MSAPKRGSIAAGALAVLVGGALGIVHAVGASASGCSQNGITLNVSAAPDIAPAVTTAAAQWQDTDPGVAGKCVRVVVTAAVPSTTANQLVRESGLTISTGTAPSLAGSKPDPAVWIPDSSVWLARVQGDVAAAFSPGAPPSLAASPVVLAVRHSDAIKLDMADGTITPKQLTDDLAAMRRVVSDPTHPSFFQLGLAEPRNDAAGLAGAAAIATLDILPGGDFANVVADYRIASPEAEAATDPAALIDAFTVKNTSFKDRPTPQMTAAFLSEQAVLAFDGTNPAEPLDAVHMDEDLAGLDYPVALVANVPTEVAAAAAMFQSAIVKPTYEGVFAAAGFRMPTGAVATGFPAAHGAVGATVPISPLHLSGTADDPVSGALALWSSANTKSRVLVMLDVSSSMTAASLDPQLNRIKLTQYAASAGLGLFTDDSELGAWEFAPGLGPDDYLQVVPIGKLDQGNQTPILDTAMGAVQATSHAGCGLFRALDAAYQQMLSGYETGKINTIVVFTDCADADGAKGMTLTALTTHIGGLASASKPIPVVLINVNPDTKTIIPKLDAISSVVGGKPLSLKSPQDILNVFLQAIVAVGPSS